MNKNRNPILAGSFMLVSLVLIIAVIVAVRGWSMESKVTRTAGFKLADNLSGLRSGDDVRIGGVRVGSVKEIELNRGGSPEVLVRFTVPKSIDLRVDAKLAIETGVTGTSNLNIEDLGKGVAMQESDILIGTPSALTALFAAAKEIGPNLSSAVSDIRHKTIPKVNETVDKVKGHIDPMVGKYNTVTDRGAEALGNIRDLFGETKVDFRTTVANLAAMSTTIKERLPKLLDHVEGFLTKGQTTLDGAIAAMEDVKKTAANLKEISGSARGIVVGNRSKIEGMVASLKAAGDNLKFATAEIRRSPWRLLYKPGAGELANLNLYDSARQFAEGANDLNDAASALRDALQNPETTPDDVKKLLEKLDKSFAQFGQIESQLWSQVRE